MRLPIRCRWMLCAFLVWPLVAFPALRLPAIFSDHMVLQAGRETACWGWGTGGEIVRVEFVDAQDNQKGAAQATIQKDGRWSLKLPAMEALPAGQTGILRVSSDRDGTQTINDVLVGEVWLASGQSNMEFAVSSTFNRNAAKEKSSEPVRVFKVEKRIANTPEDDVVGQWIVSDAQTVEKFSAVAFFCGAMLSKELRTPVGLIVSAWGGTPIETWLSPAIAEKFPDDARYLETELKKSEAAFPKLEQQYAAKLSAWESTKAGPKPVRPFLRPQNMPSRCYSAMIRGLEPYTLRGFLWYQGETNADRPESYASLFPALIVSWREAFGQGDLPFFYVELAAYKAPYVKLDGGFAWIRESQASALRLSQTGVVTAIDHGNPDDIHPKNKQPVGERLALLALGEVYGRPGVHRSPQFSRSEIEGNKVRVWLSDAKGLRARDGKLLGFVIKGATTDWSDAQARIEGDQLVVWSDEVAEPIAVRHAWSSAPTVTVENEAGLPLLPFRTDR